MPTTSSRSRAPARTSAARCGWEPQNNRYFCPCHNGTFDPSGKATGGPPGDAGQSLPRYALHVQKGLLYIDVPAEQLSVPSQAGVVDVVTPQGPGHDPCLTCLKHRCARQRRRGRRMSTSRDWIAERVPVSIEGVAAMSNEPVPYHLKRWWFALGGTPAYLFVVQIVTGILLAFYYQPSPATAYESVRYITEDASFGWYLRGLHKWGATLMIAAVVMHQMRVFFTGAYRRPRELNWMIGMTLLTCTLLLGFTGYSLVFEQLSYWGATVGANISDTVPVVGPLMKQMLLGGEVYNDRTLSRFFILHGAVLPVVLILVLMMHIGLVRLHGVTELKFEGEEEKPARYFNFFPEHFYTELIIGLTLMILLSALATLLPAGMGPSADPLVTPGRDQAGVVLLRRVPLAEAVLGHDRGAHAGLDRVHHVLLALHRRLAGAHASSTRTSASGSASSGALTIMGFTMWEALVAH